LRSTRSSLYFAAAAALAIGAGAAAAVPDDASEVQRAAALLDYVQRDYGTCVADGKVVNAVEYAEQHAFAQDAAEALARLAVGAPFAAEVRAIAELIARLAPAAEVSARAASIHDRLLRAAGLSTTPPDDLLPAPVFYESACEACHGREGRGDGFAAPGLPTRPTDFTGKDRDQLTPYRVFGAITWGVPHTAMPSFDTSLSERRRWQVALTTLAFGYSDEDARRGEALARAKGLLERARELVPLSDEELRQRFSSWPPDEVRALLAWVRRMASFMGRPPAGFPELRTSVALAAIGYTHAGPKDSAARLREAELGVWRRLEPLVAPERAAAVRDAFATARAQVAAGEADPRIHYSVAQLQYQLALAGPEAVPSAAVLRKAGARAALRGGAPAAVALAAAVVFALAAERRRLAALAAAAAAAGGIAGAVMAARGGWPWPWGICAQLCAAAALALAIAAWARRRASLGAAVAAAIAALAAGADAAATWAAAKAVFPDLPPDLARAGALCGAALLAAALAGGAAVSLRKDVRRPAALASLAVATAALLGTALQQAWLARPW